MGHAITREGIHHLLDLESDVRVIGDAANAREAFRLADDLKPDLIILDGDLLSGGVNMVRAASREQHLAVERRHSRSRAAHLGHRRRTAAQRIGGGFAQCHSRGQRLE